MCVTELGRKCKGERRLGTNWGFGTSNIHVFWWSQISSEFTSFLFNAGHDVGTRSFVLARGPQELRCLRLFIIVELCQWESSCHCKIEVF